jgi:hypothetical protein
VIVVALSFIAVLAPPARAGFLSDAGVGLVTVGANLGYIPAKLIYAAVGGVTGGLAFAVTGANYQVAERIWTPSLGGNYVLTTDHIRGREPIYFSGTTP